MSRLFKEGSLVDFELRYLRKDGGLADVEISAALLKDKEGNPTGAVGSIRDITERKMFEKTLQMSEEKYRSLIENANDGIISTNEEGEILSFNKKAEEIFGYTREEVLGKSVSLLVVQDKRELDKKALEELREKDKSRIVGETFETKGLRKDGQEIPIESSHFAIEVEGEFIITAILREISERKEYEKKLFQSEKLRSLGELAGGVAHDFNNVLAAILGNAQLLKMSIDTPPGKEEGTKSAGDLMHGLEIIEKAARDGAETVRRIQEFSRKREDDRHFATVDLNEIIDNAIEFTKVKWKDEVESKGIKVKIQKEFSTLPTTSGSAAELREVFTNLINNAVDAMPQGGTIKIKTFKEDSQIIIKVEDTGIGIPKALIDQIFDPFFTTKGVQSTG